VVPSNPEEQAREIIDRLLNAAGWKVVNADYINIHAKHVHRGQTRKDRDISSHSHTVEVRAEKRECEL
jgi:hypothetical protein